MTDFKLSCCKFFAQHPLYNYRSLSPDGMSMKLYVLLVGYGARMDTILNEILTNGQLLDTSLDVTVVSTNARRAVNALLKKAPYLPHFAHIIQDMTPVSFPEAKDSLCTLRFDTVHLSAEAMEDILLERCECSYIIISTGNDQTNYSLAKACSEFVEDHRTCIAYVQNKGSDELEIMSPMTELHPFGPKKAVEYQRQIEQIALNLHYAYAKSANERQSTDSIISEFHSPYYYASSIEAAIHVKSKLLCCGITDEDLSKAAEKFAHLMAEHPEIVEQLSVLEHSRWLMEKLLQGYRLIDDLNLIYCDGATTHSNAHKWHCCLVSCDKSGKSKLTDEDWASAKEFFRTGLSKDWTQAKKYFRPNMDDLDMMSLALHHKCYELSLANKQTVDDILQSLRKSLNSHLDFSQRTLAVELNMERAVIQMRQEKKSAISIYQTERQRLSDLIGEEGGSHSPSLQRTLEALDAELAPLLEYISYKDYKHQDRLLVQQIPFALTHKCQPVLVKALTDRQLDNLFSAWRLEPQKLIFIGMANNAAELFQLRANADHISQFLSNSGIEMVISYCICIPERMASVRDTERSHYEEWNCELCAVSEWSIPALTNSLLNILRDTAADYLDLTGADPFLAKSAETAALELGIASFYVRDGQMRSLSGAKELEYPAPAKSITIQEMFDLSGAVLEERESEKLSDLSLKYEELWNIAQGTEHWNQFCMLAASSYKNTRKQIYRFWKPEQPALSGYQQINATSAATVALMPVLRQMKDIGFINDISITNSLCNQRTISFEVNTEVTSPKSLAGFLQRCCNSYCPNNFYSLGTENAVVSLTYYDLQVKGMCLTDENRNEYRHTLEALADSSFILNYFYDTKTNECAFQFASEDVLECIQKSGTILEYYIYYSALLEAHFSDVDMGYKFLHSSAEDAAENEIDVICTKGTSSLFISAKMGNAKQLLYGNKLNYIIYEIMLLADRFGINAKPVLVAPAFSQFITDLHTGKRTYSPEVSNALRRGVYLLGRECFQEGAMGKVLDNIMDGKEDWCTFLSVAD